MDRTPSPGPWYATEGTAFVAEIRQKATDKVIAYVRRKPDAFVMAAGLSLLGALEDFLAWANIQDDHDPHAVAVRDNAIAAIRKATGASQ